MSSPIITNETKEQNFQAIAPQRNEPLMIRTKDQKKGLSGWGFLFFALFAAAGVFSYWLYGQNNSLKDQVKVLQAAQAAGQKPADNSSLSVVERLNKHILLPQAQQAQASTINNASDLKKSDTFYEYAQNGDLLIQFPNLEVIYNSDADVIVNARTKNTGQVAGAEARALQGAVSLDIRNGSGVAGIAGKTAQTFNGVKDYVVKSTGNAAKSDYSKTMVVNLTGKDVSGLEKQFGVKAVTVLPSGEKTSDADAVVIVGRN